MQLNMLIILRINLQNLDSEWHFGAILNLKGKETVVVPCSVKYNTSNCDSVRSNHTSDVACI